MAFERIAFAKIAWAEKYRGEDVEGRAAWVKKHSGDGHERFNFLPGPDGSFYGYIPPVGGYAPRPDTRDGWVVIFVAPFQGDGPLVPVGYYLDATFEAGYRDRPEYTRGRKVPFDLDAEGGRYCYVLSVGPGKGRCIPPEDRARWRVPGRPHFRQTAILYARGNGLTEPWRQRYARLADRIVQGLAREGVVGPRRKRAGGFASPETRQAVEEAAIRHAKRWHGVHGFRVEDRQDENVGYDLLAYRPGRSRHLHVEVKGSAEARAHFYMTRAEYLYRHDPRWRLAMVTNALSAPRVEVLSLREVERRFALKPLSWEAAEWPNSG